MPIKCPRCQGDLESDVLADDLKCSNGDCGYRTRSITVIYDFALGLEDELNRFKEEGYAVIRSGDPGETDQEAD